MKVLLVQSLLGGASSFAVYPLGLSYIGTAARQRGHEVRIFDPNIVTSPMADLTRELACFQPEVVGLSLRNIDNQHRLSPFYYYLNFQLTLRTIRSWSKDVPIIVGGPGFSMFGQRIMEDNPTIDFGVYLEGEESFPELLDNLGRADTVTGVYYRTGERLIFTGERSPLDFSRLFFPQRDFHDITPYKAIPHSIGLQTKRGCSLKCVYCNYPHLNGKHLRLRPAQHIGEELEYLVRDCGVQEIIFTDSVLNVPNEHSLEIFQEIKKRGVRINWNAYMHLKNINHDYVTVALSSGCKSMLFSPDAYSQKALDGMQKGITTGDIDASLELFDMTPEFSKLQVAYCFFVSPVGETVQGLVKTVLFFLKWKVKRRKNIGFIYSWIRLEPFTRVYDLAIKEKVVPESLDLLPPDVGSLAKTFYAAPAVAWLDTFFFVTLKIIKHVIGCVRLVLSQLHKIRGKGNGR